MTPLAVRTPEPPVDPANPDQVRLYLAAVKRARKAAKRSK